jgi:hypothetical protein
MVQQQLYKLDYKPHILIFVHLDVFKKNKKVNKKKKKKNFFFYLYTCMYRSIDVYEQEQQK